MSILNFNDIRQARQNLHGIIRETPFEKSDVLSDRTDMTVYLKAECLQRTGSFKLRGAYHKIASLGAQEKAKGIVSSSAGNHAQGVGFAATRFNIPGRIYVPEIIPRNKLEAIKRYRVEVVIQGNLYDAAHAAALADAKKSGRVYIPSYDDPLVMAGHGTLGLEMLDEIADLDAVIVPVGGGGLIAGVATAVKTINPAIQVIGCQSTASCAMARSLEENRVYTTFPSKETVAEGLEGGISEITFELGQRLIDRMVLVEENEIRSAIRFLIEHQRLVVEGSGAVGVAALLHNRWSDAGRKVGVVLSGGNLDYQLLKQIVAEEAQ
ncbi:MAG: threonine/serine dehydratase [Desulfobacterales bacterium]|jgi:threonine dehydratase|nr:threonine/serine dehydratase [Desulfobacterales bacterium]MDH3828463.1 threonine/serine dehydratase [Desulfobacterales bacterium]MDH4009944.1 threonine/serine dehydratase [Desulfobacterales bacterium]